MKQEYVEEQISLLGRVAEFWRLMSIQEGLSMARWTLGPWSGDLGVCLDADDPELGYYVTKFDRGYLVQMRSRAEVRPVMLCGEYEDAVKVISLDFGTEFRRLLNWPDLYDIWSDEVPVGIVTSDRENDLVQYSLGVDPSRFLVTGRNVWARGPQTSRVLLLAIDELHEIILTPPPQVDE